MDQEIDSSRSKSDIHAFIAVAIIGVVIFIYLNIAYTNNLWPFQTSYLQDPMSKQMVEDPWTFANNADPLNIAGWRNADWPGSSYTEIRAIYQGNQDAFPYCYLPDATYNTC